jgi:septum formation protein
MKHIPALILASSSPRRKNLLRTWGYNFSVQPAAVEEIQPEGVGAARIVAINAELKGQEVASLHQAMDPGGDWLVLAADTLVECGGTIYGKPKDMAQAHQFIQELGGVTHSVFTGLWLYDGRNACVWQQVVETRVRLARLNEQERKTLFSMVTPLDKAAGYGFQDAPEIVEQREGSITNVFGLPMLDLAQLIQRALAARHPPVQEFAHAGA